MGEIDSPVREKVSESTKKRVSVWQNRGASDENQPLYCFDGRNAALQWRRTGDLDPTRPEVPSKRRRITAGKGCLQESRRRRHRRKPLWFSLMDDTKKELSKVDLSTPALSSVNKPQLEHKKPQY